MQQIIESGNHVVD